MIKYICVSRVFWKIFENESNLLMVGKIKKFKNVFETDKLHKNGP